MKDEFENALDAIFADYAESALLAELKSGLNEVLEDQFQSMRNRGIIEKAAIKKVLSDLDKTVKSAELAAGGNKQKKLEHIAKGFGLSPLGARLAMFRLAAVMAAGFAIIAPGIILITGGSAMGALGACMPFAAVAAGLFIYVRLAARALSSRL